MKAIVQDRFATADDVLELRDVDRPVVKDDEVLVRIHAAAGNTYAWSLPASLRYLGRKTGRLRKQRDSIPGLDLAGQVEDVGKYATEFRPGDEVFGWCKGALAEYASVAEDQLVLKPTNLTFEQAAVVPMSGLTALQALRDKGGLQKGQSVLIVGASGGVGTFAVQIAKAMGAEVTGVCSTANLELVRSIGADSVVDYTQEDFTRTGQRYDLILDMAGNLSLSDLRRSLSTDGTLVMVGSSGVPTSGYVYLSGIARWFRALALSSFTSQKLCGMLQTRSKEDLLVLRGLLEAGKVTPVIGARCQLSAVPEATRHFEEGHMRGKAVITV